MTSNGKDENLKGDLRLLGNNPEDSALVSKVLAIGVQEVRRQMGWTKPPLLEGINSTDSDGRFSGKPEASLGAATLGVILNYLVNANYYASEGDWGACFDSLDSAWRFLPERVGRHFPFKPTAVIEDRIRDVNKYRFDDYLIYEYWVGTRRRVTNARFLSGAYLPDQAKRFQYERAWYLASTTSDEIIRGFMLEHEREGYHLPVSNRWGLADSARIVQEHDDWVQRQDEKQEEEQSD